MIAGNHAIASIKINARSVVQKYALAIILGVGALLRILTINGRGIWYDDAFSIFLSRASLSGIIAGTGADTMPPLYYFLLSSWGQISGSLAWLRLLNTSLSLGVVVLAYFWVKEMGGHEAGLWAAALTAAAPIQVYHALELRMYALLTLALAGYAYCLTRILKPGGRGSRATWAGVVLSATTALYTHNLAVFTLAAPVIILAFRKRWRESGQVCLAMALAGSASLPWLIRIPGQVDKIQQAFWTPRPGIVEIIQALAAMTSNLPLPPVLMAAAVIISIQAAAMLVYIYYRNRASQGRARWLAGFAVLPPALLFAASYLMRPVFVPRAFLLSGIAFYGLGGILATGEGTHRAGRILTGSLLVIMLMGLIPQYLFDEFPRSPFKEAATELSGRIQPGEVIVHDNKLSAFPMIYYQPELNQVFIADEAGGHNDTLAPASQAAMGLFPVSGIQEAAGDARRVYFVVFSRAVKEYKQAGAPNHPVLTYLDDNYRLRELVVLEDLEIWIYDKD